MYSDILRKRSQSLEVRLEEKSLNRIESAMGYTIEGHNVTFFSDWQN
jgi:hypothetical protein